MPLRQPLGLMLAVAAVAVAAVHQVVAPTAATRSRAAPVVAVAADLQATLPATAAFQITAAMAAPGLSIPRRQRPVLSRVVAAAAQKTAPAVPVETARQSSL